MTGWLPAPDPKATALITGASSGIGAAIARTVAERGYGVTLVARRSDRLHALADELAESYGIRAEAISCDLSDSNARARLPTQVDDLGLRIDILVNNAGTGSSGPFVDLEAAREVSQVRLMCEATVDLCAAFLPAMATRGFGAVLIVSSTTAFQPAARYATYAASKAFSLSFGQSLHAELRPVGVAVTTLCPGPVTTPFFTTNDFVPVRLPRGMWKTADAVARVAISGLDHNRRVLIPGARLRTLMTASRLSPPSIQLRAMQHLLRDVG